MMKLTTHIMLAATALTLAGCHGAPKQKSVDALDKELLSVNAADPAVKGALEDQIMVDPQLASKANAHSIRPPDEPYSAPLPPSERHTLKDGKAPSTLAQEAQSGLKGGGSGCNMAVGYSASWATKLPADLPIYPQGHVSEAAGSDTATCHLRVVSFASSAPTQAVADFYLTHAREAGYAPAQSGDTIRGTRAKDGAMFVITLAPGASGSSQIDVVTNAGK